VDRGHKLGFDGLSILTEKGQTEHADRKEKAKKGFPCETIGKENLR